MAPITCRLGFWSALAIIACVAALVVTTIPMLVASAPPGWQGIAAYAASFRSFEMLPFVPSLLLAPAFVVLMAAIHFRAGEGQRILGFLGSLFAVAYLVVIGLHYLLQLVVVRHNLLAGTPEGLALLAAPNPHSVFWMLAGLGYGLMGAATLVTAPLFTGGRVEAAIRWLFLLHGIEGLAMLIACVAGAIPVALLVSVAWAATLPTAAALLALLFRRDQVRPGVPMA